MSSSPSSSSSTPHPHTTAPALNALTALDQLITHNTTHLTLLNSHLRHLHIFVLANADLAFRLELSGHPMPDVPPLTVSLPPPATPHSTALTLTDVALQDVAHRLAVYEAYNATLENEIVVRSDGLGRMVAYVVRIIDRAETEVEVEGRRRRERVRKRRRARRPAPGWTL